MTLPRGGNKCVKKKATLALLWRMNKKDIRTYLLCNEDWLLIHFNVSQLFEFISFYLTNKNTSTVSNVLFLQYEISKSKLTCFPYYCFMFHFLWFAYSVCTDGTDPGVCSIADVAVHICSDITKAANSDCRHYCGLCWHYFVTNDFVKRKVNKSIVDVLIMVFKLCY